MSTGVKDIAGNTMASPENWSFTTIKDDTSSANTGNQNVGDSIGLAVSNPILTQPKHQVLLVVDQRDQRQVAVARQNPQAVE